MSRVGLVGIYVLWDFSKIQRLPLSSLDCTRTVTASSQKKREKSNTKVMPKNKK